MPFFYLACAILFEVIATSLMHATDGFTRLLPSVVVAIGYALAFYFLSLALRTIPTGIAYAIWCGVGIVLVTLIAWVGREQRLDPPAVAGIALIVAGVAVLQAWPRHAAA